MLQGYAYVSVIECVEEPPVQICRKDLGSVGQHLGPGLASTLCGALGALRTPNVGSFLALEGLVVGPKLLRRTTWQTHRTS